MTLAAVPDISTLWKHGCERLVILNQKLRRAPDRHTPRGCVAGRLSVGKEGVDKARAGLLLLLVPEPKCIDRLRLLTQLGWMVSKVNSDACAVIPLIPQQSSQSLDLHWQP